MGTVACLVGPEFEDAELGLPMKLLKEAGHLVELLGTEGAQKLTGRHGNLAVTTDAAVDERRPDRYDALLIPGGHSPEHLRVHHDVVQFVREFAATGRPIAAVCHGPQLLIEAAVVAGVRMTAGPSVTTDLRNAGALVADAEVVQDRQFITSRAQEDLEPFARALLARLQEQMQARPHGEVPPSP